MPDNKNRPRKPDRKTSGFYCRSTADEKKLLYQIAKNRGMSFSDMIRRDYLAAKIQKRYATPQDDIYLSLLEQLRHMTKLLEDATLPATARIEATFAIRTLSLHLIEKLHDRQK